MQQQVVNGVLDTFQHFRMSPTAIDQYETVGKPILGEKVSKFVSINRPIEFVMLGFPFKSTNHRDKVLGDLPDAGEEETIRNFSRFNEEVKKVYPPGVSITIMSDGYIFNDLLGVEDRTVLEYKEVSLDMARNSPMKILDLNDAYIGSNLPSKRERIMQHFGITPERLQERIMLDPDTNFLYRGMLRFMEEELAWKNFETRSKQAKAAKILTREMMLRNEAWSNFVKEQFGSFIRLSMHPSVNNGQKYSFQLIPGPKAKHSAWHCVLVKGDELETMHKADAEEQGLELVYMNGRPYFYQRA